MANFNDLPAELILMIFNNCAVIDLVRLKNVNKRFQSVYEKVKVTELIVKRRDLRFNHHYHHINKGSSFWPFSEHYKNKWLNTITSRKIFLLKSVLKLNQNLKRLALLNYYEPFRLEVLNGFDQLEHLELFCDLEAFNEVAVNNRAIANNENNANNAAAAENVNNQVANDQNTNNENNVNNAPNEQNADNQNGINNEAVADNSNNVANNEAVGSKNDSNGEDASNEQNVNDIVKVFLMEMIQTISNNEQETNNKDNNDDQIVADDAAANKFNNVANNEPAANVDNMQNDNNGNDNANNQNDNDNNQNANANNQNDNANNQNGQNNNQNGANNENNANDQAAGAVFGNQPNNVTLKLPNLKFLNWKGFVFHSGLVLETPNLTHMDTYSFRRLTLNYPEKIEVLQISRTIDEPLLKKMKNLEYLNLNLFNYSSFKNILSLCPKLKVIECCREPEDFDAFKNDVAHILKQKSTLFRSDFNLYFLGVKIADAKKLDELGRTEENTVAEFINHNFNLLIDNLSSSKMRSPSLSSISYTSLMKIQDFKITSSFFENFAFKIEDFSADGKVEDKTHFLWFLNSIRYLKSLRFDNCELDDSFYGKLKNFKYLEYLTIKEKSELKIETFNFIRKASRLSSFSTNKKYDESFFKFGLDLFQSLENFYSFSFYDKNNLSEYSVRKDSFSRYDRRINDAKKYAVFSVPIERSEAENIPGFTMTNLSFDQLVQLPKLPIIG